MSKNTLKTFALIGAVALLSFGNLAIAGVAKSWNLSRSVMNGVPSNPWGVWAFMQNTPGNDDPAKYTLLQKHTLPPCGKYPQECWADLSTLAGISIPKKAFIFEDNTSHFRLRKGIFHAHPGFQNQVILRWASPVSGAISLLGRVSDINPDCGDGIKWYLKKDSAILQSGVLANGMGSTFIASDIQVTKETKLYVVIDKKGDYACDSTNIDMLITSQQ
ncbi:hypothetical protein [Methylovulum psychrotolerans]|jgi:hypothetical protein|uniref:Uncharacterized protein n=1 Tax=Methylovulum psychrotolerans TaxID=1704499 RepID=A0A2S5CN63_9GAMM|nr:hypothetical protein [Methylovulum psychrotolerans]POZ52182.1 hypothetical protein AADEFJLK_01653 [Methylovulum psychrotolerans]